MNYELLQFGNCQCESGIHAPFAAEVEEEDSVCCHTELRGAPILTES